MRYKEPSRLNFVTVLMLLGCAALGGWLWLFSPAYLNAWSVDQVLQESANACYRATRLPEPQRTDELTALVNHTKEELRTQVGIRDPRLDVNLSLDDNRAVFTADYQVVIRYPHLRKRALLTFHRRKSADLKEIHW